MDEGTVQFRLLLIVTKILAILSVKQQDGERDWPEVRDLAFELLDVLDEE